MATYASEINDLFLANVDDYRLVTLYQTSGSAALNMYLEPWLIKSISEFSSVCTQDLTYTPSTYTDEGYFTQDLTLEHKSILAEIMVKPWLSHSVSNILQMNNLLQDSDFRQFSAAQNLTAKKDYLNTKREEISQLLSDYSYKHNGWSDWNNQNFS